MCECEKTWKNKSRNPQGSTDELEWNFQKHLQCLYYIFNIKTRSKTCFFNYFYSIPSKPGKCSLLTQEMGENQSGINWWPLSSTNIKFRTNNAAFRKVQCTHWTFKMGLNKSLWCELVYTKSTGSETAEHCSKMKFIFFPYSNIESTCVILCNQIIFCIIIKSNLTFFKSCFSHCYCIYRQLDTDYDIDDIYLCPLVHPKSGWRKNIWQQLRRW